MLRSSRQDRQLFRALTGGLPGGLVPRSRSPFPGQIPPRSRLFLAYLSVKSALIQSGWRAAQQVDAMPDSTPTDFVTRV